MAATAGQQDFRSLVLSCNKDGMDALRKGQHKAAFEQFKYAEAILIANQTEGDNTSLLAVTCNNLGCYYKKVGKLHGALSYLRRALKMEVELDTDDVTLAGTHLNICALLSKLEKHDKAVQHALCALDLMHKRVTMSEAEHVSHDDYSVLAIAYHNVALERDFLHQYEKAAAAFQQGYQVAKRCLGEEHPLSITLGKNCDAVLQKSQKLTKSTAAAVPAAARRFEVGAMKDPLQDAQEVALPSITRITSRSNEFVQPMPSQHVVRQDAAEWVAAEELAWASFAQSALGGEKEPRVYRFPVGENKTQKDEMDRTLMTAPAKARAALEDAQAKDLMVPDFLDTIVNHGSRAVGDEIATNSKLVIGKKTPLAQALDDHPEALMEIIEADNAGHAMGSSRTAPNDYRPNRVIKGATRTSRVVRRTGMFNSTKHRDQIMSSTQRSVGNGTSTAFVQKAAAERIQRVWRAWHKYCRENADWMTITWICATMIQAKWRSYHVRRLKQDRNALVIQRHIRGHLVRNILKFHAAAVTIQRHVIGMLTRKQLTRLHLAAVKMQSLTRGGQARHKVRELKASLTNTAIIIQCFVRTCRACRRVRERRAELRNQQTMQKATIDLQRYFRGWKGRQKAAACKCQYLHDLKEHQAATKLQAMVRSDHAKKRVDQIRAERLESMCKAATFMRKMWLGQKTRKRYRELLVEFRRHDHHIVTIQRCVRGFVVRLKLWREAVRAEEELWATLEIQRVFRGYQGRVRWEDVYERVWRQEFAAAMLQRNLRGWLSRTRVNRMRRKIARAEFDRARRRFRAAQRVQAWIRGVLSRKVIEQRRLRVVRAAVCIQRMSRGHALRQRLWRQIVELRATMIQGAARGYLVRRRRFIAIAGVICIQRAWRIYARRHYEVRARSRRQMVDRRSKAIQIQQMYRQHSKDKQMERLQAEVKVASASS